MGGTVAFIVKGYPRLSETFIAQEMLALERRGIELHIISLRHPTDLTNHGINEEIAAPVTYLPEYLHQQIVKVGRCCWLGRKLPGFKRVLRVWWRDFKRESHPQSLPPARTGFCACHGACSRGYSIARAFSAHARIGGTLHEHSHRYTVECVRSR